MFFSFECSFENSLFRVHVHYYVLLLLVFRYLCMFISGFEYLPHLFFVVLFDSVFDFHSFEDIVGIIFNFPLLLAISLFIVFNQSCETHIDTRVTHQRF